MVPDDNNKQRRNDVFHAPGSGEDDQPLPAAPPGIQTRDVMRDDFHFEVPVETVPLPSVGLTYPVDGPLHGQETLDVRAMTAREEDILTSRALIKKGTVMTELIKSCLLDKTINVDEMLSGDRNALMIALRVTGYGSDYNVEIDCPSCDARSKQSFDLGALEIKRLSETPVADGVNMFEYTLPVSKKNVRFKFLTGVDEREMMVVADRRKKSGIGGDSLVTSRLQQCIISIDGITDKNKINTFIRNMPARDSLALRRFIDNSEPGIDMKSWMECPECFESSEVRLPIGASFFWPDGD